MRGLHLNNAVGRRPLLCVVELLPQDIVSAFVGRFKWGVYLSLRKKSIFKQIEKYSKLSLGGATIGARMAKKNENLRKWVQSLCAPLRPFISEMKRKLLPPLFTLCTVDVHPLCASSLQGATKNFQLRTGGTKSARQGQRLCAPKVY